MGKRVEVYEDAAGEYRWRAIAENGQVIGVSEEGYVRRDYAFDVAAERNPGIPVVIIHDA